MPHTPKLNRVLSLEVPLVVRLGEREMTVREVIELVPGSIIELTKSAESELELYVNNRAVGRGLAVKVGENFGIRITGMGAAKSEQETAQGEKDREARFDAMADLMLSGQL